MKVLLIAFAGLFLILSGFATGYWYRSNHPSQQGEMEDYALTNVINDLVYLGYYYSDKKEDFRKLIDVNLDNHIRYIRDYQGELTDEVFVHAKIRILNDVAIVWNKNPPFQSEEFKPNTINSSWISEWKSIHEKNLELLRWVQEQCSQKPEINCKSPNKK